VTVTPEAGTTIGLFRILYQSSSRAFKSRHFRVDVDSGPESEIPSIDYLVAALRSVIKEHGAYGGDVERQ
jgi:hypothetical protein